VKILRFFRMKPANDGTVIKRATKQLGSAAEGGTRERAEEACGNKKKGNIEKECKVPYRRSLASSQATPMEKHPQLENGLKSLVHGAIEPRRPTHGDASEPGSWRSDKETQP
jgi:hypothetical protein